MFGLQVSATTMKRAADKICANLDRLSGEYITFVNAHSLVMAVEDDRYMDAQRQAKIRLCDGQPLVRYQNRHGYPKARRVAGPDFMAEIFARSEEAGYTHYFYGSSRGVLDEMMTNIKARYPRIRIAGSYAPKVATPAQLAILDVEKLKKTDADFIWIGLGAPKQEQFMCSAKGVAKGVMLGVGAGFDFFAGTQKRAPEWMQNVGLEWFYRLMQDPVRLWKRYVIYNGKYLMLCAVDALHGL